jgi:hypothetical protein
MPRFTKHISSKKPSLAKKRYFTQVKVKPPLRQTNPKSLDESEKVGPAYPMPDLIRKLQPPDREPEILSTTEPVATDVLPNAETQIAEIQRLIRDTSHKIHETRVPDPVHTYHDSMVDTPEAFDGVSTQSEKLKLLEEQLMSENRRARKLEHEISLMRAEFEEEKRNLEHMIKDLKQELHRTAPLHDNKFFSLSKELRSAMDEISIISKPGLEFDPSLPTQVSPIIKEQTPAPPPQAEAAPPGRTVTMADIEQQAKAKKNGDKQVKNKKRAMITGVVAVTVIMLLTGTAGFTYFNKPAVDPLLVQEYLTKQGGSVAGAQTVSDPDAVPTPNPGSALIPINQTVWETLTDPIFGIELQYPKNAVVLNRTDSNITFLRDSGYLFKLQQIETSLALEDYWEQIKATTLDYTVEKTSFKKNKALHLTLEGISEFPGNRYLIASGDFIYDVWYASESEKFTEDDIKRVQKMLESLTFL